jgi:hypothetical protein
MKLVTQTDLEDLALLLEDLVKRLPKMKREERIDVAARVRTAAKHLEAIDKIVKDEVKEVRKGKEGYVNGETWKAKLSLVSVTRLDQKALKEVKPNIWNEFAKDNEDQRVSFEPR